jgi:hypothetical protein
MQAPCPACGQQWRSHARAESAFEGGGVTRVCQHKTNTTRTEQQKKVEEQHNNRKFDM